MTEPTKSKSGVKGWAAKCGLASINNYIERTPVVTPSSLNIVKMASKGAIYPTRFDPAPQNGYRGRFAMVQDKVVIVKRKRPVIRVIHNPPQISRSLPDIGSLNSNSSSSMQSAPEATPFNSQPDIEQAVETNLWSLSRGENSQARHEFSPATRDTSHRSTENLQHATNISTPFYAMLPTESPSSPPQLRRAMRTDYIRVLWERDLLRNPYSAPSVISVASVATNILDRFSIAGSIISPDTETNESTLFASQSRAGSSLGIPITYEPSISSSSVVTRIYSPKIDDISSSSGSVYTLSSSDSSDDGSSFQANCSSDIGVAALPSPDSSAYTCIYNPHIDAPDSPAYTCIYNPHTDVVTSPSPDPSVHTCIYNPDDNDVATSSGSDSSGHGSSYKAMKNAFRDVEDILFPDVDAEKTEDTKGWLLPGQDNDFDFTDHHSSKSEVFSLFGEDTPGCWAGESESQVDPRLSQQIGLATSCESPTTDGKYSEFALEVAFCSLRATLPPFLDGGLFEVTNGWPLPDEDDYCNGIYNEPIEDDIYPNTAPLMEESHVSSSDDESGSQAMERAYQDVEDLLYPVMQDGASEKTTGPPLPEKANKNHLPVENGSLNPTASPPIEGTSFAPTIKRWIRRLKGKKGSKGEEQQAAKRARWGPSNESKVKK